MAGMTLVRTIDAPIGRVFHAVADIGNFQEAIPDIRKFVAADMNAVKAYCEK